jgi:taurine dioxygenase
LPPSDRPRPETISLHTIAGSLGVVAAGVDLTALEDSADALRRALARHLVLVLPGLSPTADQLVALGGVFGPLGVGRMQAATETTNPHVTLVDTGVAHQDDVWHTDATYSSTPPGVIALHMIEGPAAGGDTAWANLEESYRSLSGPLRAMLDTLTCIHDLADDRHVAAEHPVVVDHGTGRGAMFVNRQWSRRIPQLSRPESQQLLGWLHRWNEQLRFSMRWRWRLGDVVIWDNRATLHCVAGDTDERRVLQRVATTAPPPVPAGNVAHWPRHRTPRSKASDFYGNGYEF